MGLLVWMVCRSGATTFVTQPLRDVDSGPVVISLEPSKDGGAPIFRCVALADSNVARITLRALRRGSVVLLSGYSLGGGLALIPQWGGSPFLVSYRGSGTLCAVKGRCSEYPLLYT